MKSSLGTARAANHVVNPPPHAVRFQKRPISRSSRAVRVNASLNSSTKYRWQDEAWDDVKAKDQLRLLQRISASDGLLELLDCISPWVEANAANRHLDPRVLYVLTTRLADYSASSPEYYDRAVGMLPDHIRLLNFVERQAAHACRAGGEDDGGCGSREVAAIAWALATMATKGVDQSVAGHDDDGGHDDELDDRRSPVPAGRTTLELLTALGDWARAHMPPGSEAARKAQTQDLTSLLWAHATMAQLCAELPGYKQPQVTQATDALLASICSELADRLRDVATGSEMQPADLADVVWALAGLQHRCPAVGRLLDAVAHEVYRQINNRHSLNTPFRPPDLVKLLPAMAALHADGPVDATLSRMLDAVAGYVVKRIRTRHYASFSRAVDVATVLNAYADLRHTSVVIPELVASTAGLLVKEVADHHVALLGLPTSPTRYWTDASVRQAAWKSHVTARTLLALLTAYRRLGFYPGAVSLNALMVPAACVLLAPGAGAAAGGVLCVLADMRHDPGPLLVAGMLQALWRSWRQGQASAELLADGVVAVTALGHTAVPEPEVVEDACRSCLYPHDAFEEGDDGKGAPLSHLSRAAPVSAAAACRLLAALVALRSVTIQRLGWACMAVREDASGARRLPDEQLAALAGAAALLGAEGEEMAQEVLPADLLSLSQAALSSGLRSWVMGLQPQRAVVAALHQDVEGAVHQLPGWTVCDVQLQVAGMALPLPVTQTPDGSRLVVEPVFAAELLVNNESAVGGVALVRAETVHAGWQHGDAPCPARLLQVSQPCLERLQRQGQGAGARYIRTLLQRAAVPTGSPETAVVVNPGPDIDLRP